MKKYETDKAQTKEVDSDEVVKELQSIRCSIDRFLNKFEESLRISKPVHQENGVHSEAGSWVGSS